MVPDDQFTFTQAPLVETSNGYEGPVSGGTSFTITGVNFTTSADPTGADTVVDIGGNPAVITSISSDEIIATSPAGSPGAAGETVRTSQGNSSDGFVPQFTYFAVPVITGISPASGGIDGGNVVAITGTGLSNAGGVYFGGNAAEFTEYSDTAYPLPAAEDANTVSTFFVISPAGSQLGEVDITAVSAGGTSATSPADEFTYVPDPAVTGLSVPSGLNPPSGAAEGGTTVTITGTNLSDAAAVNFGSYPGTIVGNTSTQIVAISPDATQGGQVSGLGAVDVTVTTPDGTSAINQPADEFTYTDAPFIGSMSTPSIAGLVVGGPIAGNTTVTIDGDGFTGATAVNFGALAAASFTVNSDNSITAVTPAEATGTVDVSVTTANGTTDITPQDQFVFAAIPIVSAVSPSTGSIAGPTQVTISGTGLAYGSGVSFGGVPGTITSDTDNQIDVTSPYNNVQGVSLGTIDVTVTTPGGTSETGMTADQFTYMPAPAIASVSPASGTLYGGATVTITGTGLAGATSVDFGGNPATMVSNTDYQGTDTLVVLSPEATGDVSAVVDVSVTTQYGTFDDAYAYGYYPPPTVTGLSASSGPLGGGTQLTITGTNLQYASAVDFGPTATTAVVSYSSNTQIEVTNVPGGSLGTVNVQVLGLGGLSSVTTADQFTYLAAPVVTGISPNAGPSGGGTNVTIYGTGLANASGVVFNDGEGDIYAANIVSNSDGQIVVTSPVDLGGTYDIIVTTNGGDSYTSAANQFTYVGARGLGAQPGPRVPSGRRHSNDHRLESGLCHGGGLRRRAGQFHRQPRQFDHGRHSPGQRRHGTRERGHARRDLDRHIGRRVPLRAAVAGGCRSQPGDGRGRGRGHGDDHWHRPGRRRIRRFHRQPGRRLCGHDPTRRNRDATCCDQSRRQPGHGQRLRDDSLRRNVAPKSGGSVRIISYPDLDARPNRQLDRYGMGRRRLPTIRLMRVLAARGTAMNVPANQAANALAVQSGASVAVGPGAVLTVTADTSVTGSGTILSVDTSGLFATGGTLTVDMGGSVIGGPVTAAAYQLNDGTVGANLSGPGGVTKDTGGTVVLSGVNTYMGGTAVERGHVDRDRLERIARRRQPFGWARHGLPVQHGSFGLASRARGVGCN